MLLNTNNFIDVEKNYDECNDESYEDNDSDEGNIADSISEFLDRIQMNSQNNANVQGNRISAYYLPELVKHVLRICKHFPLWTNLMCIVFNSPYEVASSAAIENDFKQLKMHILKFESKPMKADKFVVTHLQNIKSNSKLFKSTELRSLKPQLKDENKLKIVYNESDSDEKNCSETIKMNSKDKEEEDTPKFKQKNVEESVPLEVLESIQTLVPPNKSESAFTSEPSDNDNDFDTSTDSIRKIGKDKMKR